MLKFLLFNNKKIKYVKKEPIISGLVTSECTSWRAFQYVSPRSSFQTLPTFYIFLSSFVTDTQLGFYSFRRCHHPHLPFRDFSARFYCSDRQKSTKTPNLQPTHIAASEDNYSRIFHLSFSLLVTIMKERQDNNQGKFRKS